MSVHQEAAHDRAAFSARTPAWWLVFTKELGDLWIGGKALNLLMLFSVLLSVMSYVLSANSELSLIPPKEMVYLTLEAAISVGLFISVIIGADSISGERERATLETMLLTPTSRRQIVLGKFLAAMSPWPAAFALTYPYLAVLSQGDREVLSSAVLWGGLLGTFLVPAFAAFGMLVSLWSNANRTSLFVSLTTYILFLIPTQFPGAAQAGTYGRLLKQVNPMEAVNQFLEKTLVNNRTFAEMASWLWAPVLFAVLVYLALFWYSGPRLRLDMERGSVLRLFRRRAAGAALIAGPALALGAPAALALPLPQGGGSPVATAEEPLTITVDLTHQVAKNGDRINYQTVVTNTGREPTSPLIVAMNIVKLTGGGDPVDPEDWSPERTQYLEALAPGESAAHSWRINTILEGDYLVYMVAIPTPGSAQTTSQPIASTGIHVTVNPFTRLNPGGVLPYAIGGPLVLLAGTLLLYWLRQRRIDKAAAE